MVVIQEYFEELSFFPSKIKKFEIIETNLIFYISSGLEIFPEHPLCNTHKSSDPCIVTYSNVKCAKLEINEYTDDGKDFKGIRRIIEHQFHNSMDCQIEYDNYYVEGVLEKPYGWISGEIIAESFFLDDLK